MTHRAIRWLSAPEEVTNDGKFKVSDSPMTPLTQNMDSVLNGTSRCALYARTAEDLSFLPDRSVDAIITDPPYYGNVMYGELSDFFYVGSQR